MNSLQKHKHKTSIKKNAINNPVGNAKNKKGFNINKKRHNTCLLTVYFFQRTVILYIFSTNYLQQQETTYTSGIGC